ncbi:MAG: hypothetical protein E6G89_18230 [Alphaproteobacteria bacterium]|nr:MAG: hypothetical protein E6G89_18230 [Alphaproteobacteria bacterium]
MSWTDERVELLKRLWTEGLSASQIAGRLGNGVTRNAVIGKVHRLNLSGRAPQPRSSVPRPRRAREPSRPGRVTPSIHLPTSGATALKPSLREAQPRPLPIPEPQPLRLVDLPKDGRVTILHLSDKTNITRDLPISRCKTVVTARSRSANGLRIRPFSARPPHREGRPSYRKRHHSAAR